MKPAHAFVGALGLCLAGLSAGWLFGWTTHVTKVGKYRSYRSFGAHTRLALDVGLDGRWDLIARFPPDEPSNMTHSRPLSFREDRDLDGLFDVWWERGGKRYGPSRWRVDLDHDEVPDWEFVETDSQTAYRTIEKRRGY